ncbi:MAG: hypothetical protein J6P88_04560, partial [Clostridia bacterium]|nr:hypothetical protein [Clostridia bacterium]
AACVFWLFFAFFNLDLGDLFVSIAKPLFVAMVVVGFVVSLVGFAVLFSCYTDIGMPDEKNAPEKPGLLARMKQKNGEDRKDG